MAEPERDEPSLELELPRLRRPRRRQPPAPPAAPDPSSGEQATVLEAEPVAGTPPAPRPRRTRPAVGLPSGWAAAVLAGLMAGLIMVGLTWASLQTCQEVQGTSTCGRAGYPMLALVLAVAVLVGGVLLRLAQMPDPVTTSLLGVGLAAIVALLVLIDHLDQPAMVVVVPGLCSLTFAGAHWLTTSLLEPGTD